MYRVKKFQISMPAPSRNFFDIRASQSVTKALRERVTARKRTDFALLLQNDGKTHQEIAKFIGCSPRTVAYWCQHGDPDNLESLHNKREQESHRKATPSYIQLLLLTVEKKPQELGYEFGRWTGERLATYLAEQTGIELSGSQVGGF
jgi:transposase